jgi:hypothetical protein
VTTTTIVAALIVTRAPTATAIILMARLRSGSRPWRGSSDCTAPCFLEIPRKKKHTFLQKLGTARRPLLSKLGDRCGSGWLGSRPSTVNEE